MLKISLIYKPYSLCLSLNKQTLPFSQDYFHNWGQSLVNADELIYWVEA